MYRLYFTCELLFTYLIRSIKNKGANCIQLAPFSCGKLDWTISINFMEDLKRLALSSQFINHFMDDLRAVFKKAKV